VTYTAAECQVMFLTMSCTLDAMDCTAVSTILPADSGTALRSAPSW
jgi:hypothetical protein